MNKLFILILCLLSLLVYFNSLNNSFVFDDKGLIICNPAIKSIKSWPLAFKRGIYDHWIGIPLYDRMYRPLQTISYGIDYKIWGLNPFGFHLTNLLLHLFNGLLVYYLLFAVFSNPGLSFVASALFLIHPVQTSVVSYIAGRADLLSLSFILLSLILFYKFIKKNKVAYYFLSLITAILALLSRENSLFLFIFIALILYILKPKAKYYLFILPLLLLDTAYLFLRASIFGYKGLYMHPEILTFPLRLINFLHLIIKYMLLLIMPFDLHLLRVTPFIKNLLEPKAVYALILCALCILVLIKFRKNRLVVFGLLWFFFGLLPVLFYLDGFPLFEQAMMAESWVYLSSIGFFIILAYICSIIRIPGRIVVVSLIIFYSALTIINNSYWADNLALYERILKFTPGRNPVRRLLIDEYLLTGQYKKALSEINNLARYYPDSQILDTAWGDYYTFTGKPKLAKVKYDLARIKNKPFYCIVEQNAKR